MLVVEGPDGGGKTTLAHQLSADFDLEYRKPPAEVLSSESGPVDPRGLIRWWLNELDHSIEDPPYMRRGVYDRTTFISDPIYRLTFGDPSAASVADMRRGIEFLGDHAVIVWCIPALGETFRQLLRRDRIQHRNMDERRHAIIWWAYNHQMYLWREVQPELGIHHDWVKPYPTLKEEIREYITR